MASARLCLLLLLPLGCCQRSVSQITEWIGEVEGSGKTSSDAYLTCCGFCFCNIHVCKHSNFLSLSFFLSCVLPRFRLQLFTTKPMPCFTAGEDEWVPEPDLKDDTYWSGSAPLCVGGCRARHQELRRDPCGDSSCCWLGYKSLCRGKTTTTVG